jgi:hypothetical protein
MSHERLVVLAMMVVNGVALYLIERWSPASGVQAAARRGHIAPNLVLTGLLLALNFVFDRLPAWGGVASDGAAAGLLGRLALPGWVEGERIACGLDECDSPDKQRAAGLLALPFAP